MMDILGAFGVGLILLAYFCNTFSYIRKDGKLYFAMNVLGAALACYTSWLIHYLPFVILEATWTLVSIVGLIKCFSNKE
ncbi:MAG: CBU_0592 family membrane protein [Candidatus Melainabacteria bacterium]|jgi:hypothetical protein